MTSPDPIDWPALLAHLAHHGCHTWILYGSRARGDAHPTSDIDLLGIRDGDEPDRDTGLWQGLFLDAFIYPTTRFETLGEDWLHLHGGRILQERDGLGTRIITASAAAVATDPPPLPAHERRGLIAWHHKMVQRIAGRGPDDVEAHYRRAWLLMQILEDYFVLRGRRYRGPKESLMWLAAHAPADHAAFAAALAPGADLALIEALVGRVVAGMAP
jgi:hypothetical protein